MSYKIGEGVVKTKGTERQASSVGSRERSNTKIISKSINNNKKHSNKQTIHSIIILFPLKLH